MLSLWLDCGSFFFFLFSSVDRYLLFAGTSLARSLVSPRCIDMYIHSRKTRPYALSPFLFFFFFFFFPPHTSHPVGAYPGM